MYSCVYFFFFKQKTAYEMRISDWSSDVCSSDLCQNSAHAATVEIFGHGGRLAQQKIQLHIAEAIIGQVQQTIRGQSECIGIQSPGDICSPLSQHCTNIDLCHRTHKPLRRSGQKAVRMKRALCAERTIPSCQRKIDNPAAARLARALDRKSTRLNSSH